MSRRFLVVLTLAAGGFLAGLAPFARALDDAEKPKASCQQQIRQIEDRLEQLEDRVAELEARFAESERRRPSVSPPSPTFAVPPGQPRNIPEDWTPRRFNGTWHYIVPVGQKPSPM